MTPCRAVRDDLRLEALARFIAALEVQGTIAAVLLHREFRFRGLVRGGHLPVGVETAEMVEPDQIEELEGAPHPPDPPVVFGSGK